MNPGRAWKRTAVERGEAVTIVVDDARVPAFTGETIATAMLAVGVVFGRDRDGRPRTPLCNMGTCFECVATVDGRSVTRTCLVPVREGLTVRTEERL